MEEKTKTRTQFYNLVRTNVGKLQGHKRIYLGYVRSCTGEKCKLSEACTYAQKGKCKLELLFLNSIYDTWIDPQDGIGDIMTQQQFHLLGASLMPLYGQLIACEKIKMGLGEQVYKDSKGIIRMHPVLKEIRDVNKMILVTLKEAGLLKTWETKFGKDGRPPPKNIHELERVGKRDRYKEYEDAMKEEEEKES